MDGSVRQATTEDIERLSLIGAATFLETFAGVLDGVAILEHCRREHSTTAYEAYLRAGAKAWLAELEPGGAPIGFALLGTANLPGSAQDGADVELKRIYTLSRFHGRSLGSELMRRAIEEAVRRGAKRLLLGVYAENARAIAFYRKWGFEQIADRRFQVGAREYDDVVLARRLTAGPAGDDLSDFP